MLLPFSIVLLDFFPLQLNLHHFNVLESHFILIYSAQKLSYSMNWFLGLFLNYYLLSSMLLLHLLMFIFLLLLFMGLLPIDPLTFLQLQSITCLLDSTFHFCLTFISPQLPKDTLNDLYTHFLYKSHHSNKIYRFLLWMPHMQPQGHFVMRIYNQIKA